MVCIGIVEIKKYDVKAHVYGMVVIGYLNTNNFSFSFLLFF